MMNYINFDYQSSSEIKVKLNSSPEELLLKNDAVSQLLSRLKKYYNLRYFYQNVYNCDYYNNFYIFQYI